MSFCRLDKQLLDVERSHRIPCRWNQAHPDYKQLSATFSREKRSHLVEAMWAASSRRQFLLKLKAKYAGMLDLLVIKYHNHSINNADGQTIAKKLAKQISKETKTIKALLPEYNACQMAIETNTFSSLSIQEVLDPDILSQMLRPHSSIPSRSKQELMDAHILIQRACEEVEMLRAEMGNMVKYYEGRCKVLEDTIQLFESREDAFGRGALSLLKSMHLLTDNNLQECMKLFEVSSVSNEPEGDQDSDCESDSEFEYSSDEDCI